MVDVSTLALELSTTGLQRGHREAESILSRLEARLDRAVQKAQQVSKQFNDAFKFGGGGSAGQGAAAMAAGLDKAAAATRKAADETLKYAQAQARLRQVSGDTAGAIQVLTNAMRNHEGSARQMVVAQTQLTRLTSSQSWTRYASTIREAGESIQQAGYFLTGLTTAFVSLGVASVKSAFEVDKSVNTLKALLGSADAAESRFAALQKLSQTTPGLTTGLASQLDVQLRVANATEKAINKVLPAIGKLNAVSNLQDPQRFVNNLVQLVTQNFERIDLKELVGQSPLAGELIKQIFSVDSPINGEAIRAQAQKLGLTTVDAFFTAFGEAAARNSKLANITESLETRFAKLVDRVTIALRPLGEAIINTLAPLVERGANIIEGLSQAFSNLPKGVQTTIVVLGALTAVVGPAVIGIGALIQTFGALGNLVTVARGLAATTAALQATTTAATAAGTAAAAAGTATTVAFAPLLPILLGIAAVVGIAAIAWANYETASEKAAKITVDQIQATIKSRDETIKLSQELTASTDQHGKLASVIEKMPPSSKAFANALKDEGDKLAFVTEELTRQRSAREAVLGTQSTTITGGLVEQQKEIDLLREKRKALEQEAVAVQAAAKSGLQQLVTESSQGRRIETTIQAQARLGSSIQSTIQAEEQAIQKRNESAQKLGVLEKAQGRTTESLVQYLQKAGLSAEETTRLQRAITEYDDQQRKAASATNDTASAMDNLGAAARKAGKEVADAFLQFDLSGLQKTIQSETKDIAKRIVEQGISAKQAVADAQKKTFRLDEGSEFAIGTVTLGDINKRAQALKKAEDDVSKIFNPPARSRGGGSGRRGESDARQLRAAEEELAKSKAASLAAIQERGLRSQLDKEKEYFAERLTNAEQFFVERKRIELELISISEQRLRAELKASAARFSQAKDGSPEALRELAQIIDLRGRLKVLDIDRADKLREINAELEKNLKAEREIARERLAAASASIKEGLTRVGEQLQGIDRAQLERPASDLRKTEIQLQALANAGILRETELQDALTLARRAAREEILASLQVERERAEKSGDPNRFSQIQQLDEQILSIQTLGSELTRAEALQRRFADQGVLDYRRLNEGVEDLLASQKGLTEIFSDFRANLVADQFGLIETGVDALTKKLGVFGDAIGQLLKDLAKLAISKVFQKLFGLGGGGSPGIQFGGAPQQQGGGGFNPLSLITGGGNGGGFSLPGLAPSGGGGFGQFATGGFAGGNPVQQILGGGSSGGGGGLLGKIPFIGKLFGGGGGQSLVGGIGKNIGDLPGAIQGVGLPPLQAPGGAIGGAGTGLGASFASLGAGGLLAGGGLLGSLAGGNSQIGRLLGGVGGSLLGGAVGASGLLGGGIAGALPALFSNPITAIVGGALIGGALLARFIGDREFNRFRKDVRGEYQIEVDKKDQGRALYKSIKELGEQAFGKGKFGKRIPETIRLPKAQEQLAAYGEATGQNASSLVTRFRDARELQDPFDARNQFIKRATGGGVVAGQPYIVGDAGRPEVFPSRVSGEIFPSIRAFEQQLLQSLQASKVLGGIFAGAKQQLIGQLSANTRQGAPEAERFDGRRMERAIAAVGIGLASLSEEVGRLKFASPNDVVMKADAGTVADKTAEGLATGGQRVTDMQVHLGL